MLWYWYCLLIADHCWAWPTPWPHSVSRDPTRWLQVAKQFSSAPHMQHQEGLGEFGPTGHMVTWWTVHNLKKYLISKSVVKCIQYFKLIHICFPRGSRHYTFCPHSVSHWLDEALAPPQQRPAQAAGAAPAPVSRGDMNAAREAVANRHSHS